MKTKKLKFIVGTVVILGAVLALAITGMEESKAYYQTVPELKAMGVKAEGRRVRVAGDVVVGSIERQEEGVVTFVIDHEGILRARYIGPARWDAPGALEHFRGRLREADAEREASRRIALRPERRARTPRGQPRN